MLETVELPARVANLDSSLPDMDGETFPHDCFWDGGWCKVLVQGAGAGWRLVQGAPQTRD